MKTCVDGADAIASKLAPTRFMRDVQDFRITESPLWERACSRRGQLSQLTLSALLAMSLSACTVGPDFHKPQPTQITEWSKPSKAATSQVLAETMKERWWEVFNDPKLSALTQRALTDNLDLKLASSRLQQSRAVRQVITANRYPNTAATGSYTRKRNSGEGLSGAPAGSSDPIGDAPQVKRRVRPETMMINALDYFGTWKLFDALCDAAFTGKNREYALGNTPQQRFMGLWSDGTPVKELKVTDKP